MVTIAAQPLITTVIPTYRRPVLVRRAILSALNQTYPHVQVCVYDNASGDETELVVTKIAQHDSRVRYHRHTENMGPYNNFNYGISKVDTPFFSLLSDDDMLAPTFYEMAMQALMSHQDAMFSCMATMVVNERNRVISPPISVPVTQYFKAGDGFKEIVGLSVPNTWTGIVFRREVMERVGVIDLQAGPFADAGYVWHAAARFPFVVAPGVAAVLMAHANSTSGGMSPINKDWPGWWERMIYAVEHDQEVPQKVRTEVRGLVAPNFRRIAFLQVGRALGDNNVEFAEQAAKGLYYCGHPATSIMLRISVWCCRRFPPLQYVLRSIRNIRRRKLQCAHNELHTKFGHHVEFIRRLNQAVEAIDA